VRYMLLLNSDAREARFRQGLSTDEAKELRAEEMPRWRALIEWMAEEEIEASRLELDPPREARVVRVREGKTVVTDGPFTETKEVLGGYFLADCKDLDQAIEVAQRVPLVSKGSVEIRPLVTR
jgi:hypothetical protein